MTTTINRDMTEEQFWSALQERFPDPDEFEIVLEGLVQPQMKMAYMRSRQDCCSLIALEQAALGIPLDDRSKGYVEGLTRAIGIIS